MSGLRNGWWRCGVAMLVGLALFWPSATHAQEDETCASVGQHIVVRAGEEKTCNLVVVTGNLTVEPGATVNGVVDVIAGDAEIGGKVNGPVFATGDVVLRETAEVDGNVTSLGHVERASGATVRGEVVTGGLQNPGDARTPERRARNAASALAGALVLMLVAGIFAALVVAVAPNAVGRTRDAASGSKGLSLVTGLFALLIFPVLLILLLITIIGAVALPFVYLAAGALGWVAISDLAGGRFMPRSGRATRAGIAAALIAFVLSLASAGGSALGCLSFTVWLVITAWALGASALTLFGTRPWPRVARGHRLPPADTPPAAPEPMPEGEPPALAAPPPELEGEPAPETPVGSPGMGQDLPTVRLEPGEPGAMAAGAAAAAAVVASETMDDDRPTEAVAGANAGAAAAAAAAEEPPSGPTPGWGWSEPATAPMPEEPVEAAPPSEAGPEPMPPSMAEVAPSEPARVLGLQDVPGITPIYAHLLREAGIGSLAELASASPETVAEVISVPGVLPIGVETAAGWVRAASEKQGGA